MSHSPSESLSSDHEDLTFLRDFECERVSSLDHRAHVRLAWLYLRRESLGLAAERLTQDLRRFAARKGHPNLFHATITWAYLILVHERMASYPASCFREFADTQPDLFGHAHAKLLEYYDRETLLGEKARRVFLWPRRQTL